MQLQIAHKATLNTPLSRREWEVLYLVAAEYSNDQIAQELVISPYTVKAHLQHIFNKLNVQTRLGAVMVALRRQWLVLV